MRGSVPIRTRVRCYSIITTRQRAGGTGAPFDWSLWPRSDRSLILAGGLTPENVAAAVVATRPFAVDVASGVEGDTKGRKDAVRLHSFVEEANNA